MAALGIALIFLFIVASTYLIIMPSRLVRFINFFRLREVYNDYRRNGGGHDNFKNLYELSDGVAQKLLRMRKNSEENTASANDDNPARRR